VHQLASGIIGDGDQAPEVLAFGGELLLDAPSHSSWLTFHRYRTRAGPLWNSEWCQPQPLKL
jgi:hypothetical protein